MALPEESKFLDADIIQSMLVKRIFHMILDIVQSDENKPCDCAQRVNYPVGRAIIKPVLQSGSIDDREKIDKYLTISPEADGCAMSINCRDVSDSSMDVLQESEYFEGLGG